MAKELKLEFTDCRDENDEMVCKTKLPQQCKGNDKEVICRIRSVSQ